MPIYEYECEDCEVVIELLQKVNDPAPTICSECGGKLTRVISGGTTFRLIGDGFYNQTGKMD